MGLSSISIPNTVKRIGNYAFTGCYNLYSVYFGGTQEEWCNIIFDDETSSNPLYGHGPLYFNNQELTELVIKEGTVEVDSRFCRCNSIEKVVLPSSVKVLLDEAFSNCRNLKEINIPENIIYIKNNAFYGCSDSTSLVFMGTSKCTTIKEEISSDLITNMKVGQARKQSDIGGADDPDDIK